MNLRNIIDALETTEVQQDAETRALLAKIASIAQKRMKESSVLSFDEELATEYITDLLEYCIILDSNIPVCPATLKDKERSTEAQNIIKNILSTTLLDTSTDLLNLCLREMKKSKTILELRTACKLYREALRAKKDYMDNQKLLEEYEFEAGDLEQEFLSGKEAKRQLDEIYEVYSQDDKYLDIVIKTKVLRAKAFKDSEIIKVLGISKKQLEYAHNKVSIE